MAAQFLATTLSFYIATSQIAPQWGTLSCDTSVDGIFPPGPSDNPTRYQNYNRWYKFTKTDPTILRRDVLVQTCIEEDGSGTFAATIASSLHASTTTAPNDGNDYSSRASYNGATWTTACEDGEIGNYQLFTDVPAGDWDIGISNTRSTGDFPDTRDGSDTGGRYKVSVRCLNRPFEPELEDLTPYPQNITTYYYEDDDFNLLQAWEVRGSNKISCDASAMISTPDTVNEDAGDFYSAFFQFEITEYATQIMLTTCDPDTIYDNSPSKYPGTDTATHSIKLYYWDFPIDDADNRQWRQTSTFSGSSCRTLTLGGNNPSNDFDPDTLSPGIYFAQIGANSENDYVLSMLCWDVDTVKAVDPATDYVPATVSPTEEPTTAFPTRTVTVRPTPVNTSDPTMSPSAQPTMTFDGVYNNIKKAQEIDTISCGVHRHDVLERKQSNWYKFEVLADLRFWAFDTCLNDQTKFTSCLRLYELDGDEYDLSRSTCSYCGFTDEESTLTAGHYAIEIYGSNRFEEYGEYILRMGCDLNEYDLVTPVDSTDAPTPAPVGVAPIPAKDGRIVGDISCGITVTGETSAESGDFHKFTVIGGGIDWVRFDTCDETSFNNYLFVWDHWNQTGHEQWNYGRDYSIGFHFEHTTTCNSLTMNDLTPGVYYVNIDGFNYYFDYGTYTIKMECSDSGSIKSASNFEEYRPGLEWWAILLIILAVLLCCGCLAFGVWKYKKTENGGSTPVSPASPQGGDSPGNTPNETETEMQETGGYEE